MTSAFPPGPRARYPGDLFQRFRRDSLGFLAEQLAEYGNVFGFRVGPQRFVFVNEPDFIRDVLVTHQKPSQPAFQSEDLVVAAARMVEHTERLSNDWRDGQEIDAHDEMMRLSRTIVAASVFGTEPDNDAVAMGAALHDVMTSFNFGLSPFAGLFDRLPTPSTIRFRRARATLDAIILRNIRDRRASRNDRSDLLSVRLRATHEGVHDTGLSDEQLRDEVQTLFHAGHETTANALTWAWYLLARNPKAEEQVHAEVDALGHTPSMEDLPQLDFTRRVVAEAMRLYPPAYILGRRATRDLQFGNYRIPGETIIICSPFIQHRDTRWYSTPEQFDADRWLPAEVAKRPKFSYFPFGTGTGISAGEQFAWMEATLVLGTLLQKWRLWIAPKQRIAIEPNVTLRPRYGMQMVARRR